MLKLSDIKNNIDNLSQMIAAIVDEGVSVKRVNGKHPHDIVYFCELPNSKFFLYMNKDFFTFDLYTTQHSIIKKNISDSKELVELITKIGIKQTIITVGGSPQEPKVAVQVEPSGFFGGDAFSYDLVTERKKWNKIILN